jgi:hypothetical protein
MKLTGPYFIDSHAPEMAEQIRRTHVGQASWAGTGPPGETCATCKFYGCWKQVRDAAGNVTKTAFLAGRCDMFRKLVGKIGPAVPSNAPACRYFAPKEQSNPIKRLRHDVARRAARFAANRDDTGETS